MLAYLHISFLIFLLEWRLAHCSMPTLIFNFFQDMSQQPPWQELVAADLHGNEWHFRHIFRGWLLFIYLNDLLNTLIRVSL